MRTILLFLLVYSAVIQAAVFDGKSARRELNESYLKYKLSLVPLFSSDSDGALTASESAKPFGSVTLPEITSWSSMDELQTRFEQMRDRRWMQGNTGSNFLRRSSWLYPDDGCFARASLANMNLASWHYPIPNKIFVFGNLFVRTKNSPQGYVSWWFHVAPIVEVQKQKYVLDPAIEPKRPLPLEQWLARMNSQVSSLEVAICGSGAYVPSSRCDVATDGVQSMAQEDQIEYLDLEWDRLVELHRSPERELGDQPPW